MRAVVIEAPCGTLRGTAVDGVVRARGIPYGVADRYRAPRAAPGWAGIRDATGRGPACPQGPSRLDAVTGPVVDGLRQGEDCLVVTVTAPARAERAPVMVWLHGGAYLTGSGEAPKYDADRLAREGDVVVVNVSYRLGLLGYLSPGDSNLGLRDQLLALRWVRDSIGAFGGDPARVTVFGQSAGGDSIVSLLTMPEARTLVRRAIVQSAPLGLRDGREELAGVLHGIAGRGGDAAVLQADMVRAARKHGAVGNLPFAPEPGSAPLPAAEDAPARLAEAAAEVELLIGTTADDAAPFVALSPAARRLARAGRLTRPLLRRIVSVATSRVFAAPADGLAAVWRSGGGSCATYRFAWSPPGSPLGACHCIELPFLLGDERAWRDAPMLAGRPAPAGLGSQMRSLWAGFAHDGTSALPARSFDLG